MTRILIRAPSDASNPDWDRYPDEEGVFVFKIQVEPQKMARIRLRSHVLQLGRRFFFLMKAQRIPIAPTQAPLMPYKVWCKEIQ